MAGCPAGLNPCFHPSHQHSPSYSRQAPPKKRPTPPATFPNLRCCCWPCTLLPPQPCTPPAAGNFIGIGGGPPPAGHTHNSPTTLLLLLVCPACCASRPSCGCHQHPGAASRSTALSQAVCTGQDTAQAGTGQQAGGAHSVSVFCRCSYYCA